MKPFISQAIDDIVRGPLASKMKAIGFRRSGAQFARSVSDLHHLVEVDRWKWNERTLGGVRVVFGAFCPQVWRLRLEVWPELSAENSSTKPRLQMCPLIEYMSTSVPFGEEPYGYWPLQEGDDVQAAGASFASEALKQLEAWFATHSSRAEMIEALAPRTLAGDLPSAVSMLFLACVAGMRMEAKTALDQILVRKPGMPTFKGEKRELLKAIAERHGVT